MAKWVDDGMIVDVPARLIASATYHRRRKAAAKLGAKPRLTLRCVVACAMGDTARITNDEYNIDTWVHVDHLLVVPQKKKDREHG